MSPSSGGVQGQAGLVLRHTGFDGLVSWPGGSPRVAAGQDIVGATRHSQCGGALALADDAHYERSRERVSEARLQALDAERRIAISKERCKIYRVRLEAERE